MSPDVLARRDGEHLDSDGEELAPRLAWPNAWTGGDRLVNVVLARRHRRAELAALVRPDGHDARAVNALENHRCPATGPPRSARTSPVTSPGAAADRIEPASR